MFFITILGYECILNVNKLFLLYVVCIKRIHGIRLSDEYLELEPAFVVEAKAGRTRRQFPPRRSAVVCFTYACCGAIYPFIPVGNWTVLPVAFRIREGDII